MTTSHIARLSHFAGPVRARSGNGAFSGSVSDRVTLGLSSERPFRLTSGLLGGATMVGMGMIAAAAAPVLGVNGGALAGGALFAAGVARNGDMLKGFGLAAIGGALCATGAAILGAIPLAMGLGMLAVEGMKLGG